MPVSEREALARQLHGDPSHKHVLHALDGLEPALVGQRTGRSQHTIWQILQHMVYWQRISLDRLAGRPQRPATAALGWTAAPAPLDVRAWQQALGAFADDLQMLVARVLDPTLDLEAIVQPDRGGTAREEVLMIQGHNSYHLGQIVWLRQELGAWPPPSGGDTW